MDIHKTIGVRISKNKQINLYLKIEEKRTRYARHDYEHCGIWQHKHENLVLRANYPRAMPITPYRARDRSKEISILGTAEWRKSSGKNVDRPKGRTSSRRQDRQWSTMRSRREPLSLFLREGDSLNGAAIAHTLTPVVGSKE